MTKIKIKQFIKGIIRFIAILVLSVFVFLGAWCIPPKMVEKVLESFKPKFTTENILKKDKDRED